MAPPEPPPTALFLSNRTRRYVCEPPLLLAAPPLPCDDVFALNLLSVTSSVTLPLVAIAPPLPLIASFPLKRLLVMVAVMLLPCSRRPPPRPPPNFCAERLLATVTWSRVKVIEPPERVIALRAPPPFIG